PVLVLLIATGRMSAVVRDQRLVSLRLIGVSKGRTLVAAVAENVSLTLAGAAVGLALLAVGARLAGSVLPVVQPFSLTPLRLVALVLAVAGVSGLLALTSARTLQLLPTQARRGGLARPASPWRALPVVVAVACFLAVPLTRTGAAPAEAGPGLFLGGVAVGAVGIATAPALVARASAVLLRRSRRVVPMMAGRTIEADPSSATRRVAAVGVGLFAVLVSAAVMDSWESTSQYRYATLMAER